MSDTDLRVMGCFKNLARCVFAALCFPCKDISKIPGDIEEMQCNLIAMNLSIANSMPVEAFCGKMYFC